jgi:hypothetical protein
LEYTSEDGARRRVYAEPPLGVVVATDYPTEDVADEPDVRPGWLPAAWSHESAPAQLTEQCVRAWHAEAVLPVDELAPYVVEVPQARVAAASIKDDVHAHLELLRRVAEECLEYLPAGEQRQQVQAVIRAAAELTEQPVDPAERLRLDDQSLMVYLDGKAYSVDDPKAYAIYSAIARSSPNPITKRQLRKQVRAVRAPKTVPTLLKSLPAELYATVRVGNRGYLVCLPPPAKKALALP